MLIPGEIAIPPVGDSRPRVLPTKKGCAIEQVAVYADGTHKVRIVEHVWNKFSDADKAGLLIHEALYRRLRELGDSTSDRARKVVGYLFGGHEFHGLLDGAPLKFLTCWSNDKEASFRFIVYPANSGTVTAHFLVY